MVSLLNIRGCKIGTIVGGNIPITSEFADSLAPQGIVNDNLLIPEVLLEDYHDNISTHLYSIFQAIWNDGGWADSPIRI